MCASWLAVKLYFPDRLRVQFPSATLLEKSYLQGPNWASTDLSVPVSPAQCPMPVTDVAYHPLRPHHSHVTGNYPLIQMDLLPGNRTGAKGGSSEDQRLRNKTKRTDDQHLPCFPCSKYNQEVFTEDNQEKETAAERRIIAHKPLQETEATN